MAQNILTFVEQRNGEIKKGSLEALTAARKLADQSGGTLSAVLLGKDLSDKAPQLGAYGVATVYVADHPDFELYSTEAYAAAAAAAKEKAQAPILVFSGTSMGKDLAPRLAARFESAYLADVIEASVEGEDLVVRRPMYAGKVIWKLAASVKNAVLTVRPNVFSVETPGGEAQVEALSVDATPRARVTAIHEVDAEVPDVAEADVVVSGGRGIKGPENFPMIFDLAKSLGGAVGASRAVVDAGWIDHDHQVGQTGKTVSPTLYIAVGISGAIQHLAGMRTSKTIVAINKDPEAPVFGVSDYGLVGDSLEIVPKLTEAVKAVKG